MMVGSDGSSYGPCTPGTKSVWEGLVERVGHGQRRFQHPGNRCRICLTEGERLLEDRCWFYQSLEERYCFIVSCSPHHIARGLRQASGLATRTTISSKRTRLRRHWRLSDKRKSKWRKGRRVRRNNPSCHSQGWKIWIRAAQHYLDSPDWPLSTRHSSRQPFVKLS